METGWPLVAATLARRTPQTSRRPWAPSGASCEAAGGLHRTLPNFLSTRVTPLERRRCGTGPTAWLRVGPSRLPTSAAAPRRNSPTSSARLWPDGFCPWTEKSIYSATGTSSLTPLGWTLVPQPPRAIWTSSTSVIRWWVAAQRCWRFVRAVCPGGLRLRLRPQRRWLLSPATQSHLVR